MCALDERLRITFLTVMPSPYMQDLFEAFNSDPRFRLSVKYLERDAIAAPGTYWQERPLPNYATVLPGCWYRFWGARVHVNSGVVQSLRVDRPDLVVVAGYNALSSQIAMWWLRLARVPWIFWGEIPGLEKRGRLARTLRWLAQRPAVSLSSAVAGIGARAARVYRKMVAPSRPVWNIPYCCDLDPFNFNRAKVSDDTGPRFLYCGQLVPRKGVDLLVRSFVRVADSHRDATLTLVGAGPMKPELTSMVPVGIRSRVNFAGFHEVDKLPQFFAGADVFVLPSRHDGWGLVVNQALGAGLPIIASSAVGAAEDLVCEGENGTIFPSGDEGALTKAMESFAESPELICKLGKRSLLQAELVNPKRMVDRWYDLCHSLVKRRSFHIPDSLTL
jgi:glycosyltransferase involved in cell wall biosynthesis